jgi:carbonic anhydrase
MRGVLELQIHYKRIEGSYGNSLAIVAIKIVINDNATDLFRDGLGLSSSTMSQSKTINFKEIFAPILTGTFFVYRGSLTKPPCSEIVTWAVAEQVLEVHTESAVAMTNMIN